MNAITVRKREKFLNEIKTKGDVAKNSAIGTLRDVGVGVVGGGLLGSLVGRHSFLVGLATSFGGYYFANRTVSSLGMGMMAANGFQIAKRNQEVAGTQGLEGFDFKQELENAKQRVVNFRDNFAEKLYMDSFLKKDEVDGLGHLPGDLGEVDYYLHGEIEDDQDALDELDRIEAQLLESAKDFDAGQQMEGMGQDLGVYDVPDEGYEQDALMGESGDFDPIEASGNMDGQQEFEDDDLLMDDMEVNY
ncbi:MAG: hypothetical protein AAF597_08455 [Bacteroidota bacterium]